tara:strand:- start:163 stop:756 length:594 start_codon:yes stop_codon:yes gene_type:complete
MSDLNLQNLKVNEVLKFDDYHHIVLNDDIDLNGMLGIVKSIHQDKSYNHYQIEVELINKKYSEDLEEWDNCLWFTIPENEYNAKFTVINRYSEFKPFEEEIYLNQYNCPLFRVSWNGDEIITIHSKETLIKEYRESNLFDDHIEWVGYPPKLFELNNIKEKRTLKNMYEVIEFLNDDDLKELNFIFISDNCEITRIK